MRNKYPGYCFRCGEYVGRFEGHFERTKAGTWLLQHAECAIRFRNTEVGRSEPKGTRPPKKK